MDHWYIARGKVEKGPFSFSQIQAAVAKGVVLATDKVLQPGTQQWVTARLVPGLFPNRHAKPELAIPAEDQATAAAEPARPTVSPIATVIVSEAGTAIRPSKKTDWLRVTRGFLGRFGGTSEAGSLPHEVATRRSQVWQRVAVVGVGLCVLVVVPFLLFGGKSGPAKTVASPTFRPRELELPPVGPTKPPAPDRVMQEFKAARAEYVAALTKARADLRGRYPGIRADIQNSNLAPQEKAKSLKRLLDEQGEFVQPDNTGSGRIHTHPAMQPAVAAYLLARANAGRKFGEVADQALIAYSKAGVTDQAKLGPLQAARLVGRHPDLLGIWEGTLPQGQRPMFVTQTSQQVWHIGVDEKSGGWLISGYEAQYGMQPRAAFLGQNIQLKDGVLTFLAAPVDEEHTKPQFRLPIPAPPTQEGAAGFGARPVPKSTPLPFRMRPEPVRAKPSDKPAVNVVTLKPQDGDLHCETQGRPQLAGLVLHRTDEERRHELFDRYEKKTVTRPLDAPTEAADLNDANYVWRRVAQLASFAYYRSSGWTPLEHEALYLPYRRDHLALTPGASGPLLDLMTGSAPGARVNQSRGEALLRAYEGLSAASHPYLKQMTDQAAAICRSRLRLALADEQFGNTAASSIREFQQTVFIPGVQYAIQREADVNELRESIQRENPNYRVIVTDAPLSEASEAKWREFMKGAGNIKEDIQQRGVVSGLLAYADMAQIDLAAAFWQTWLLPLAKRCGGPVSRKPLVNVEAAWANKNGFQRLSLFYVKSASEQDLTHVVLELMAENEWGEKASHYCYFDQLEVADSVSLVPHFRWEKRRLDFTNTISVTWSMWADQGSEVGRKVKLTSPVPNPDPASWRKDYLNYDQQYQAKGEAVGALMQSMIPLPLIPERQRRLIRDAAAPRKSYAFRLQSKSSRTLVLRFLSFDQAQDTFEAELFDLRTREPFDPQTTVWKGKLNTRPELGILFNKEAAGTESGWAFALVRDDQPMLFCPAADKPGAVFPTRNFTLFAVEVP